VLLPRFITGFLSLSPFLTLILTPFLSLLALIPHSYVSTDSAKVITCFSIPFFTTLLITPRSSFSLSFFRSFSQSFSRSLPPTRFSLSPYGKIRSTGIYIFRFLRETVYIVAYKRVALYVGYTTRRRLQLKAFSRRVNSRMTDVFT